jgi:hypothetical protein
MQEPQKHKMLKSKISLLAVLFLISGLVGWGAIRMTKRPTLNTRPSNLPQIEQATLDRLKEHARIHQKDYELWKGKKLIDLTALGKGPIEVSKGVGSKVDVSGAPPFNLNNFIKGLTCESDAVVIGTVKTKISQPTADGTLLFTDYGLSVEEVIKQNSSAPIEAGSEVIVTRIGGTILLNNRVIRVIDDAARPLEVQGRYLLFLRFIPATGAYKAASKSLNDIAHGGGFQLREGKIFKLTAESLPREIENGNDAETLIAQVRTQSACGK